MSSPDALEPAKRLLQQAVGKRQFPGAQVLVAQKGEILWKEAAGSAQWEPEPFAADTNVFYDLASLTKPLVTATGIALLAAKGMLSLDDPLEARLPIALRRPVGSVRLRDLLAHQGGLPAWKPYYEAYADDLPKTSAEFARTHKELCLRIVEEPLTYEPGAKQVYSDLDFILLGEALSATTGRTLQDVYAEQIAKPLKLAAHFRPLPNQLPAEKPPHAYAATEYSAFRGRILCGEVDDDNAAIMGGVAGHAGLFGTVDDVFSISQAWLNGYHGREHFLPKAIVREFWHRASSKPEETWTLGWDSPSDVGSMAGSHFSKQAVGHLGFTGTSLWLEPESEIVVCLLTNRVHPSRENESMKTFRPAFHDAVMQGLIDHVASH